MFRARALAGEAAFGDAGMNVLSLFSGIGGFDLAFEREGFDCVAHSETDKNACEIFHKHFPNSKCLGDIKEIDTNEIKNIDIITGGFPCQDLSVAGARSGLAGARSGLFFDMARIIGEIKPSWIVLENVPGLLSSHAGADMATVIATLSEIGYCVAWRVLDSRYFGVAQRRRRVFIVGSFGNGRAAEILFECKGLRGNIAKKRKSWGEIAKALTTSTERGDATRDTMIVAGFNLRNGGHAKGSGYREEMIPTMDHNPTTIIAPLKCDPMRRNGGIASIADEFIVAPTLNTCGAGTDRVATAGNEAQFSIPSPHGVRRLTPLECERLQGFPETEKYIILKICKDDQSNPVCVGIQSLRSQKSVGSAEKKELLRGALFVQNNLSISYQQKNKPAQMDVLIDCVGNGVEILSQGKLLLNAKNATKKSWSHPHIKTEDFVQMLVGLNTMLERIMKHGEEELLRSEQPSTHQKNGRMLGKLYGDGTMQPVGSAENDSTILKKLLKSITSNHLDIESSEQKLLILSSFVIRAIGGFIHPKTLNQNIFTVGIKTKVGWTEGLSDRARYRALGNAVTVNVAQWIARRIRGHLSTQNFINIGESK